MAIRSRQGNPRRWLRPKPEPAVGRLAHWLIAGISENEQTLEVGQRLLLLRLLGVLKTARGSHVLWEELQLQKTLIRVHTHALNIDFAGKRKVEVHSTPECEVRLQYPPLGSAHLIYADPWDKRLIQIARKNIQFRNELFRLHLYENAVVRKTRKVFERSR